MEMSEIDTLCSGCSLLLSFMVSYCLHTKVLEMKYSAGEGRGRKTERKAVKVSLFDLI